ncbi:MAG: hypothetical protein LBJ93_04325 [Clostridiales bacterium]|jgi:hypothetical protein|nr:hypothetical protein [Clostridiales bacterium]
MTERNVYKKYNFDSEKTDDKPNRLYAQIIMSGILLFIILLINLTPFKNKFSPFIKNIILKNYDLNDAKSIYKDITNILNEKFIEVKNNKKSNNKNFDSENNNNKLNANRDEKNNTKDIENNPENIEEYKNKNDRIYEDVDLNVNKNISEKNNENNFYTDSKEVFKNTGIKIDVKNKLDSKKNF